jgi:lactoylglutathione lyase
MSHFKHLGHIAIRVKNLEASIAFYNKLGFKEMLRLYRDNNPEAWIVYLRINDETILELFPGGAGDYTPTRQGTGVGVFHISLTVDDLDATQAYLESVGIHLIQPRKTTRGVDGNRGMWIADPDGTPIEVMEMAPDCIQYKAMERLRAEAAKANAPA